MQRFASTAGRLALGCALAQTVGTASPAAADSTEVAAVEIFEDAMPQGPSIAERLALIREKIQRNLAYPAIARLHSSDGEALLRFEIEPSGKPSHVRVVRSSGVAQLDASAIRAVEASSPLPWVYGPLEVPVHFELTDPD